jgi:hypothetical protein
MKPRIKNRSPHDIAMVEMNLINFSISIANGVSETSADYARVAICPITVLSPVLKIMPTPCPFVQKVPKKATLGLSKMFLSCSSADLRRSSDSPVKDALLTFISLHLRITISAGIFLPFPISTISPTTSADESTSFFSPCL